MRHRQRLLDAVAAAFARRAIGIGVAVAIWVVVGESVRLVAS